MNHKEIAGGVCAAKGFKAAGVHSGIRRNKTKKDMMMIAATAPCAAAAVYTQNKVKGAPLVVTRQHLADGTAQGILCNSGNANTCAPGGLQLAHQCCEIAAAATGIPADSFIVASTGVIGQVLPTEPFEKGIPQLAAALSTTGSDDAAAAIMTTDIAPKQIALEFTLSGKTCHIGGICKGSGMVNPNMATILCFITTDAALTPAMLQKALSREVVTSFNQVCIDGDTSTNDMATILASGLAQNPEIGEDGEDFEAFCAVLGEMLVWMSQRLAADGEGASKLLNCCVMGAPDDVAARAIAKSVISSDLFKSAMFCADANWGRCLCAIGYAEGDFPVDDITLAFKSAAGEVTVCQHSAHHPFSEEEATRVLSEDDITILIDMGGGPGCGNAWGCDLTYDYVKVSGSYRK